MFYWLLQRLRYIRPDFYLYVLVVHRFILDPIGPPKHTVAFTSLLLHMVAAIVSNLRTTKFTNSAFFIRPFVFTALICRPSIRIFPKIKKKWLSIVMDSWSVSCKRAPCAVCHKVQLGGQGTPRLDCLTLLLRVRHTKMIPVRPEIFEGTRIEYKYTRVGIKLQ